jgi:hypothetical protein
MLILELMLVGVCAAPENSRFGGGFLVSIGLFCLFHYLLERNKIAREIANRDGHETERERERF